MKEQEGAQVYVILRHDLDDLGKIGDVVTKEELNAYMRKLTAGIGEWVDRQKAKGMGGASDD